MASRDLTATSALVTGAGRGFGRAIAVALHGAGADVVAVGRTGAPLEELNEELGGEITTVVADVADPVVAGALLEQHRPTTLVLNAGASPLMRPLHHHTWETFSRTWEVDVRQTFHWVREALLLPLSPGSTVVALSSGAALFGSPLSGGYSGAKATIRFIAGYGDGESARAGLGIRFVSVLPKLTGDTDLGAAAAAAYAGRDGISVDEYFRKRGPGPSAQDVGRHITGLAASDEHEPGAYLLTPQGLSAVP
jgi:NAD(P)-dependent dehydrogenase (short-subunit alcohol dehydrogenase family)